MGWALQNMELHTLHCAQDKAGLQGQDYTPDLHHDLGCPLDRQHAHKEAYARLRSRPQEACPVMADSPPCNAIRA